MVIENLSTERLATQRMVYNHMKVNNLNAEDTEVTHQPSCIVIGTKQKYYRILIRKKWVKCKMKKRSNGEQFRMKPVRLIGRKQYWKSLKKLKKTLTRMQLTEKKLARL